MTNVTCARDWRAVALCACMLILCGLTTPAPADAITQITLEAPAQVDAGDSFSFLIRITAAEPPVALIGYSLNLEVTPELGAGGTVVGDPAATNFYLAENLLTPPNGGGLHSLSTIGPLLGNPGLGITGIDATLTANAVPTNGFDVLAEAFFDVSGDAFGTFRLELTQGTGLADNDLEEVEWESSPVWIDIPEPGYLGIMGGAALLMMRRRRRSV